MALVLISLGSNVGNRLLNLKRAGQYLESGFTVENAAAVYETPPYGFQEQNRFYNSAVTLQTALPPQELLTALLDIEKKMGRVRVRMASS